MFCLRILNPYENMPCVGNEQFKLYSESELFADLDKITTLFDVSQYLVEKVYKSWEERSIRKRNKGPSIFSKLVITK
jgi:hypothetical protein